MMMATTRAPATAGPGAPPAPAPDRPRPAPGGEGDEARQPARRAQDVGGADAAAAVAADVGHSEQPGDEVSDRHGAHDVRGSGREDDHDQRSSSGTMAR